MRTIKPSDVKKDELFFVFFSCAILSFSIARIYASVRESVSKVGYFFDSPSSLKLSLYDCSDLILNIASKIKEAVQKLIRNPL